jgi:hypothetical protein
LLTGLILERGLRILSAMVVDFILSERILAGEFM